MRVSVKNSYPYLSLSIPTKSSGTFDTKHIITSSHPLTLPPTIDDLY